MKFCRVTEYTNPRLSLGRTGEPRTRTLFKSSYTCLHKCLYLLQASTFIRACWFTLGFEHPNPSYPTSKNLSPRAKPTRRTSQTYLFSSLPFCFSHRLNSVFERSRELFFPAIRFIIFRENKATRLTPLWTLNHSSVFDASIQRYIDQKLLASPLKNGNERDSFFCVEFNSKIFVSRYTQLQFVSKIFEHRGYRGKKKKKKKRNRSE